MASSRRLAAILAADIAGYSALMGASDVGTVADLKEHQAAVMPLFATHGGRVVDTAGDGILAEFPSAVGALECALAFQTLMAERNAAVGDGRIMNFRIGVDLGEVIYDDARIYGDGVNVAARLEGLAEPGGICISDKVHREARGKVDIISHDLGLRTLKNIAEPVRVHRIEVGKAGGAAGDSLPPRSLGKFQSPDKPSIAVLSFANMSGDPEQEYFADGIAEDIITALSKVSQLFVIARNSSFVFKGKAVHVQDVCERLGVRYVLEGSVRKSGSKVRITAQLIDGSTGGHMWAERFDRDLTDIFTVQDEVTQQIVDALAINLTRAEPKQTAKAPPQNLEAYDYFLRARAELWRQTKERNKNGQVFLQRATELDPNLAPAYAFLAVAHAVDYINSWSESPISSLGRALQAGLQSVNLDSELPYAHWALAVVYLWSRRHDEAIEAAERAISLDQNFSSGHMSLGLALHYSGKSEAALDCFDRGMALDPFYPDVYLHFQAQSYFQLTRYEEAVEILKRRIERNPDTDISRVLLAASYGHLARIDDARKEWRELRLIHPDFSIENRRKLLPYKNPEDSNQIMNGLRIAGLTT